MADTAIKTSVEDAGPCLKKIKVEVPADVVSATFGDGLTSVSAAVALPGFRKGRVPERLIRRRFASEVAGEAKTKLISDAYQKAVEEHELKVISEPSGEHLQDKDLEEGQPFDFELEVEVAPDFDLPELGGVEIKKPVIEIDDERVQAEIAKICINEGELENREQSEPKDYLTGVGKMTDQDGTEHYNINGAVVQVPDPKEDGGKGMILGVLVDDFAKQIGTPKAGDSFEVKVKGPESHEKEEIRGKDLTISFEVQSVDRIAPAQAEDAAKKLGFESVDQLTDLVRQRLEQRATVEQQSAMRSQMAKHLIDTIDFETPERLTEAQAARNLERRRFELQNQGVAADEIEQDLAERRALGADSAARDLKLFFILARIADEREVQVTEPEINGQIARLAYEQRVRPEQLRDHLIQSGRVNGLYQQIREHKTLDALIEDAKVEEVSVEDFNKEFGSKS